MKVGGEGRNTLGGYRLRLALPGRGERDFWGNPPPRTARWTSARTKRPVKRKTEVW